jgi:hypothetical protein
MKRNKFVAVNDIANRTNVTLIFAGMLDAKYITEYMV